jgi:GT2 family glycosyltransferase
MAKVKKLLTVVIPLRNTAEKHRDLDRLKSCLASLRAQTMTPGKIDIVVSDLDSDAEFKKQHEAICTKYKARHIYTETSDVWNISRARNVGIRAALADYVMMTDVDCIFAPNFVETVIRHVGKNKIVNCRISDLPQDYDGTYSSFLWMATISTLRPPYGLGGCQAFPKAWAMRVGGYDEEYREWGADDTDFQVRAERDGLKPAWIERETSFFHIWHPSEKEVNRAQTNENRIRLKLSEMEKLPIERNPNGWGGVKVEQPAVKAKRKSNLSDIAVMITTFMRDEALFECVKSVRRHYPNVAIVVADNGRESKKRRMFCKEHRCQYVKAPFDVGVGAARNAALKTLPAKYKYIVNCEDDLLFTDETRIEYWASILDEKPEIGIVGCLLKKADARIVTDQHYEAWMYAKAATLFVERIDRLEWEQTTGPRLALCDIVMNVFMMRREVWEAQPWDERIKTWPEHEDFFLGVKKNTAWKVAYTDNVSVIHRHIPYTAEYEKFRMRIDGIGVFAKKWGIEYIWNSWHKDWGKPNPMRIGLLDPPKKPLKADSPRDVAVGIKTFLREDLLFQTLDAIEDHFPYLFRFYIADDGSVSDKKELRYRRLEEKGHVIIRLPYNSGISVGRNEIVKRFTEPYLLMMDDDIVIEDGESIRRMKAVLDSRDEMGVCSGMLFGRNGDYVGNENYQKGLRFETSGGILFRYPAHRQIEQANGSGTMFVVAEQVVNFFLAKREVFDDVRWDNRIKVEWEHMDFFLSLLKTKWKAAVCLEARAVHLHSILDPVYNQYRRAVTNQYFFQKHEIHNVINRFR